MFKTKKNLTLFVVSSCIVALTIGVLIWNTQTSTGVTNQQAFYQSVNNALAEISLPNSNNSTAINAASENLANFIQYRSGVQISQANKTLLRENEQKSWNQSKRLSTDQLAGILTEIASDKLRNLTDAQLNGVTESLRGFNAPDLPQGFQNGRNNISFRASGKGTMTVSEFTTQINHIRGSNVDGHITQSLINNTIALEINNKVNILKNANSNFFGGSKDVMTPMQAVLITYAVVTDDLLNGSQPELLQNMLDSQQRISHTTGTSFPSPQGHHAYGLNGYKYSTPTNLLVDDSTLNTLITRIAERSNLQ